MYEHQLRKATYVPVPTLCNTTAEGLLYICIIQHGENCSSHLFLWETLLTRDSDDTNWSCNLKLYM